MADWGKIYITDTDKERLCQYHVSTWSVVTEKLNIILASDITALAGVDVWFASGSMAFIEAICLVTKAFPQVVWLAGGGQQAPSNGGNISWFLVSHARIGGSTSICAMFGSSSMPGAICVQDDPISRSIAHVLKYWERPISCQLPFDQQHYTVDDWLLVHHLDRPVLFMSRFSWTSWGQRPLVAAELGQAFDLPSFVDWIPELGKAIVPIHLFREVVDAVQRILPRSERGNRSHLQARSEKNPGEGAPVATRTPAIDATWFPALGKWLPGSWTDVPIASKTVKSDDATVDCVPWNRRILLVLGGTKFLRLTQPGFLLWENGYLDHGLTSRLRAKLSSWTTLRWIACRGIGKSCLFWVVRVPPLSVWRSLGCAFGVNRWSSPFSATLSIHTVRTGLKR